ncbi:MAG: peptidylprolyl isomerase [Candidatus Zixiibacteriota bacterium]|nr:MAG: peptidylprolyl isomerase [candidate division Zixibacteria bacterium]
MRRLTVPVALSALLFVVWNGLCTGTPPKREVSRDEVLAKVNDEIITVGRFQDHLRERKITSASPDEDEKRKGDLLHELIRQIRIEQRAAGMNLESDPRFVGDRDDHMRDFLLDYMYQKEVVEKIEVTDQEVKDHYQRYLDEDFLIPEEVEVRDLLIRVQADSTQKNYGKRLKKAEKEAEKEIRALHRKAQAGEDFAGLCTQHSQAGTASRSGKLGFIKRGQMSPQFDSAAFSLEEIGDISEPVRDLRGYHLIQLLDRKEKSYQELDSTLLEGIRGYLEREKTEQAKNRFVDSLKNEVGIYYNLDILNDQKSSFDSSMWVMVFCEEETIRFTEYNRFLASYKFDLGRDSLSVEEKKGMLFNYFALHVILEKEARKRGYADLVEYRAEERAFTIERARELVIAGRVRRDFPPPSMEEMEAYYQAHKIDFPALGVPVHVYHIVFDDSQAAAEVLDSVEQGAGFETMARRYFPGEPEIKDVAYDLGFITKGEMPDEFYQVALSLQEGEVSQPVKTKWGHHLIKVVEKKEEGTTFSDIIPKIKGAVNLAKGRKHIADWEESLIEEADVWIDEELLKKVKLPKPEG